MPSGAGGFYELFAAFMFIPPFAVALYLFVIFDRVAMRRRQVLDRYWALATWLFLSLVMYALIFVLVLCGLLLVPYEVSNVIDHIFEGLAPRVGTSLFLPMHIELFAMSIVGVTVSYIVTARICKVVDGKVAAPRGP